ncbi:hypothetical protein [Herbiconiux sp. L3-i23]|uniref:hypothetical protein n=1 Tax=Herbiconiux sp. L3-i23 TaxID=2905871 RepID=UPI002072ADF2|nr:hypothetical protein [Herbiconiux sp. L3-i23]
MNAIATAQTRLGGDIVSRFDAVLGGRPVLPAPTAGARVDEGLWFVRTLRRGGFEVVPFRRGRLAFSAAAVDSLLRLAPTELRRVHAMLGELAAATVVPESDAALFVAGGSIIVAEYPADGPSLIVSQLA